MVKAEEIAIKMQKSLGRDKAMPEGFGKMLMDELDKLMRGYFVYGEGDLMLRLTPTARGWAAEILLDADGIKSLKLL